MLLLSNRQNVAFQRGLELFPAIQLVPTLRPRAQKISALSLEIHTGLQRPRQPYWPTAMTGLVVKSAQHQGCIGSTKAKRIGQNGADRLLLCCMGNQIDYSFNRRVIQIQRWRRYPIPDGKR